MKRVSGRAIIIDGEDVILMFRRRIKDGIVNEYYAIPGGGQDEGETIEECVKREILEEFNLKVELKDYLGKLEDEKTIGHVYNAQIISGNLRLSGEELERNTEENYYEVRRVKLSDIDHINLLEENREFIRKAIELNK